MKLNKQILLLSITYGLCLNAMQPQPTKVYSENASEKLMKILRKWHYSNNKNQLLIDIKNALKEGADPNYSYESRQNTELEFIRDANRPANRYEVQSVTIITPLREALLLKDMQLIQILLDAGADPELRNISSDGEQFESALDVARRIDIKLPIQAKNKLP